MKTKLNPSLASDRLKKFGYWTSVVALGTVLGVSLQFAGAWTEPASAPPTANIGAPVNTGDNVQIKQGTLQVNNAIVSGSTTATPSPAPNGTSTGNMYANDVYIGAASKWASETGISSCVIKTAQATSPFADDQPIKATCDPGYKLTGCTDVTRWSDCSEGSEPNLTDNSCTAYTEKSGFGECDGSGKWVRAYAVCCK